MTHWYRLPGQMSVAKLLFHRKQHFIVDRGLSHDLKKCMLEGARICSNIPESEELSRQQVIQLCKEKHGVLVTSDEEYASALRIDVKGAWGIILLPRDVESQARLWREMSLGISHFVRQTKQSISSNMPGAKDAAGHPTGSANF